LATSALPLAPFYNWHRQPHPDQLQDQERGFEILDLRFPIFRLLGESSRRWNNNQLRAPPRRG